MGKKDIIKSVASILVIIVLAILIINVNKLINPKINVQAKENFTAVSGEVRDYGECFNKDPSTIVFVHSNYCPHCKNMMPIVKELEGEGYKFYWAESSDIEARDLVNNCFGDLLSGYVPQFICPATWKEQTREMSKEDLKKFADDCI